MSIRHTGLIFKHHDSNDNIGQVHQIVTLVWNRSKEWRDIFLKPRTAAIFHPLRDSWPWLRHTWHPLLAISRLFASWRGFEVDPWTRTSDYSEKTWPTSVRPKNVRLLAKVQNDDYCHQNLYDSKVRIDLIDQSVNDDIDTNNLKAVESYAISPLCAGEELLSRIEETFRISLYGIPEIVSAKVSRPTTGTVPCVKVKIWFTTIWISAQHIRTRKGSKLSLKVQNHELGS